MTTRPEANFTAAPWKVPELGFVLEELPVLEPEPLLLGGLLAEPEGEPLEEPLEELLLPDPPEEVPLPPAFDEPPLLEPVEDGKPPGAVPDAVGFWPGVEVELREMKWPPAIVGGAVLLPDLAAASLYASRVLGEGGALLAWLVV